MAPKEPEAAKATSGGSTSSSAPSSSSSRVGDLLRLLTCRRRLAPEAAAKATQQRYQDLVLAGRKAPEKRKEWYDKLVWWSEAETKTGARIFVIAPRGPMGEPDVYIDMWELLSFALGKMHHVVVTENKRFAVVWAQMNDQRMMPWTMWFFKNCLVDKYLQNFEALHVVHPSWTVRVARLVLWPIASEEFWDYFHAYERIEFLDTHVDLRKFKLPKDLYEHDKWLDKQAMEMTQQAKNKGSGGGLFGYGGGSTSAAEKEETKKYEEQMEKFKKLLEEKGYGANEDAAKED